MNEPFLSNILLNSSGENEDRKGIVEGFQEIETKGFEKYDRSNCRHYLKG